LELVHNSYAFTIIDSITWVKFSISNYFFFLKKPFFFAMHNDLLD